MRYWKTGLACALVALPAVAIAAGPGGGDGWGRHGGRHHMGFPGPHMIEMLQGMDTDRNGVISAEEFAAGREDRVLAADADGDGAVTLEEMEAFAIARVREHVAERFARMDADGDGTISAEELAARWQNRFARMDRDGDGNLTIHDLPHRGGGTGDRSAGDPDAPPVEPAPAE
jgi:hypothetical protein